LVAALAEAVSLSWLEVRVILSSIITATRSLLSKSTTHKLHPPQQAEGCPNGNPHCTLHRLNRLTAGAIAPTVSQSSNILANAQPLGDRANFFSKGDVAVSAAVKGKKAAPKKAAPKKVAAKKTAPKKVAAKKAALRKPKQVENLTAGAEVRRKFTMTVQVSGREFLDDPVAATRRVLILALAQIPVKIHEEPVDNESIYKSTFNKRAESHFNGVLNDPKNPTSAGDFHSLNVWEWRPADL
jgi:hypothetical protein